MHYLSIIITSIMLVLTSCKKEVEQISSPTEVDHGGFDPSERQAKIEIDNPIDGSIIPYQDVLKIKGNIYANFNMHGYSIEIFNHDDLLWNTNKHVHGSHFEIDYEWENSLINEAMLTIKFTVVGNHYGTLDFQEEIVVFAQGEG